MYNLEQLMQEHRDTLAAQIEGAPATLLRSIKIKIISNCNLKCEMCKYWRIAKQRLEPEVVFSVLDHAAKLGCRKVHFSGGEVTLHRDLTAIIEHAANCGMRVNLTSNGMLMDKQRARDWIAAGLRAASFSLDGVSAKTHDGIRGVPGAFKRTVRAIRILRREIVRREARLRVRVNMVLSRHNLDQLAGLIRLVGELGVVDVLPMPIDGTPELQPTVEEIRHFNRKIVPQVHAARRDYGMPVDALRLYPFGRSEQDLAFAAEGKYALGHYQQNRCYAPWLHSFVSHTGEVFACCMTRQKMNCMGNVNEQTLTDIFQGELYQQFRQGMLSERLPICANCDQYLRENRCVDHHLQTTAAPQLVTLTPEGT